MVKTTAGAALWVLFPFLTAGIVAEEKLPLPAGDAPYQRGPYDAITDVPGVTVGHYTHTQGTWRGTTVVFPGECGGICAVEVRGSNRLTLGTSTFDPVNIGEECDAVVLTGGSAFGLATVAGVVDYLYERGRGMETRAGPVPIVPAAVIFDLPVGEATIHPQPEWGYRAAQNATGGSRPTRQRRCGSRGHKRQVTRGDSTQGWFGHRERGSS